MCVFLSFLWTCLLGGLVFCKKLKLGCFLKVFHNYCLCILLPPLFLKVSPHISGKAAKNFVGFFLFFYRFVVQDRLSVKMLRYKL